MGQETDRDLLVAGAGPVGLCAALHAVKNGLSVRIIDQADRTNQESYALALHSAALRMFEDLGLAEKLIEVGRPLARVVFHEGHTPAATVDLGPLDGKYPFVLVVPQGDLEAALVAALRKEGVKIEWGHELVNIEQVKANQIRTTLAHLKHMPQGYAISEMRRVETNRSKITTRFLIGADGAHSTVRRLMGAEVIHHGRPRFFQVFEFETPRALEDELRVVFANDTVSALWPMTDGRARWTFETDASRAALPDMAEFHALVRERAPWFSTAGTKIKWAGRVSFASWHASQFARGAVWLAGDAAHQTPPLGVQSMNGGLLEAADAAAAMAGRQGTAGGATLADQYHGKWHRYWQWLLDPKAHQNEIKTDNPFAAKHAEAILAAIPATGTKLPEAFASLKPVE